MLFFSCTLVLLFTVCVHCDTGITGFSAEPDFRNLELSWSADNEIRPTDFIVKYCENQVGTFLLSIIHVYNIFLQQMSFSGNSWGRREGTGQPIKKNRSTLRICLRMEEGEKRKKERKLATFS